MADKDLENAIDAALRRGTNEAAAAAAERASKVEADKAFDAWEQATARPTLQAMLPDLERLDSTARLRTEPKRVLHTQATMPAWIGVDFDLRQKEIRFEFADGVVQCVVTDTGVGKVVLGANDIPSATSEWVRDQVVTAVPSIID